MIIEYLEEFNMVGQLSLEKLSQLTGIEFYKYCKKAQCRMISRSVAIWKYGFAIPNEEALQAIIDLKRPIVEIGAGIGYWAYLLQQYGVDIVAFDTKNGHWFEDSRYWTEVIKANCKILQQYSDRVLFSCWPYYYLSQAEDHYKGDTMIYIGEECTDHYNEDMWKVEQEITIPNWENIRDYMLILRRK